MMLVQYPHQEKIDELHKMPLILHIFTFPDDPPLPMSVQHLRQEK